MWGSKDNNDKKIECPNCGKESDSYKIKRTSGSDRIFGQRDVYVNSDGTREYGREGRRYDEKNKDLDELKKPHCRHCKSKLAETEDEAKNMFK